MLRNPTLYGITHDELEKDPLLEQVGKCTGFNKINYLFISVDGGCGIGVG